MLNHLTVPVTPYQQNCSLLWCGQTMRAAVLDPGGDLELVLAQVTRLGLALEQIWLTHGHIDHAGGAAELSLAFKLPIIGPHLADQFLIDSLALQGKMFGLEQVQTFKPTRWLSDGDTVSIGPVSYT